MKTIKSYWVIGGAIVLSVFIHSSFSILNSSYRYLFTAKDDISVTGSTEMNFTSDLIVWRASFSKRDIDLKTAYKQIKEDKEKISFGWIKPQPNKFSVMPVLLSSFLPSKLFNLTSNLNGGRRAMVPTGVFETLMPQDFLPTQLLRSLIVMDTDVAQSLGALELDEEDLALVTFACPAKYEYGSALRDSLNKIEKEG